MTAQTILPANSASSGSYQVDNSVRFDDGSGDILARSNGTPSSQRLFTFSGWYKKATLASGVNFQFFALYNDNTDRMDFRFQDGDTIDFRNNAPRCRLTTNRLFRDPAAWYHVVLRVDTTQSTAANRIRLYINGVQETSFSAADYGDQNDDLITNASTFAVGDDSYGTAHYDGNMSEVVYCDGQSLAPTSFGEFDSDSGIWKPISVSGLTFGDQGFYLEFKGTGTSANSSGIGADTSGNDNHLTVTALAATSQGTDTCTNNFAVLNPLNYGSNYTWSEGNLQFAQTATNWDTTYSSMGVTSGKWYMEFKGKVGAYYDVGVTDVIDPTNNLSVNTGCVAWKSNSEFAQGGNVGGGLPSNITSPASNTYTADDIIGIALDVDNEAVYFAKNGTYEVNSDPTSGATKTGATTLPNSNSTYFFAFAAYKGSAASGTGQVNFGGGSVDAISSGNADADGHGNFEHAPPSGYFALCTKNLAEYGG
jgi:hypothetical protein